MPIAVARSGVRMTSSGSMPSRSSSSSRTRVRRSLRSHSSRTSPSGAPVDRLRVQPQQPEVAQVQHHLGHAAGEEDAHGRVVDGAVRQHADDARHGAVDARPVLDRRAPQARGVGDRGDVQQQVGRAAEGRVHDHRVVQRVVGDDVLRADARRPPCSCRARAERRASSSQTGWPEGASAEWQSASPSASATTCAVAAVPRNWQPPPGVAQAAQPSSAASRTVSLPCVKRAPMVCTAPASSPTVGGQRHAAGHDDHREVALRGQRQHHRGQALVAGRHAHHAAPRGQRADQAAEHDGRVVAVGEAVHHAERALRAAVARVAHEAGERRRRRRGRTPRRPPA